VSNCDGTHPRLEFWEVNEIHRCYEVKHDGKTAFVPDDREEEDALEEREPRAPVRQFFVCPDCGDAWDARLDDQSRWVRSGGAY
jgi:hypothetical protein